MDDNGDPFNPASMNYQPEAIPSEADVLRDRMLEWALAGRDTPHEFVSCYTYDGGQVMIIVPHGHPVVPRVLESQIGLHHGAVARLRAHRALQRLAVQRLIIRQPKVYGPRRVVTPPVVALLVAHRGVLSLACRPVA